VVYVISRLAANLANSHNSHCSDHVLRHKSGLCCAVRSLMTITWPQKCKGGFQTCRYLIYRRRGACSKRTIQHRQLFPNHSNKWIVFFHKQTERNVLAFISQCNKNVEQNSNGVKFCVTKPSCRSKDLIQQVIYCTSEVKKRNYYG